MTNLNNFNNLALIAALASISEPGPRKTMISPPKRDYIVDMEWPKMGPPPVDPSKLMLRAAPNGFDTGREGVKIEDVRFAARDNPRAPISPEERERRDQKRKDAKRARRRR